MEYLSLILAGLLVATCVRLRSRQVGRNAASPRIPCDRCGTPTPSAALIPSHREDGQVIELCAKCEWPGGF